MIGLDTNVLVRYVMQDDPKQSARASRVVEGLSAERPGFVSVVVAVELVWVLSVAYGLDRESIAELLQRLQRSEELRFDRPALQAQALQRYRAGRADFADCLIERIGHEAGCTATVTFDAAVARAGGMTLVD